MTREDWMRMRPVGCTCETHYDRSCCYEDCQADPGPEKFLRGSLFLAACLGTGAIFLLIWAAGGGLGEY